jgi:hypothetical protein
MISGVFQVGETVIGTMDQIGLGPENTTNNHQELLLELLNQIIKKVLIIHHYYNIFTKPIYKLVVQTLQPSYSSTSPQYFKC